MRPAIMHSLRIGVFSMSPASSELDICSLRLREKKEKKNELKNNDRGWRKGCVCVWWWGVEVEGGIVLT